VEVLELTSPELALVRLAGQTSEGMVPIACLKLSPLKTTAPRAAESEQGKEHFSF